MEMYDNSSNSTADDEPWARAISMSAKIPDHLLRGSRVECGRRGACHIVLKHPAISGIHCTFVRRDDGSVVVEDHATNGTFLNGAIIGKGNHSVELADGDVVLLLKSSQDLCGYKIVFFGPSRVRRHEDDGSVNQAHIISELEDNKPSQLAAATQPLEEELHEGSPSPSCKNV